MKVETYILYAANGNRIRRASKVVFADGSEIKFTEKLGKKEAIKQALDRIGTACVEALLK